jgi:hypothetical protein
MSFIEEETTHYAFIPDPPDDTCTRANDDTPQLTSFVEDPDYYEFAENSMEPGSDESDNCQ